MTERPHLPDRSSRRRLLLGGLGLAGAYAGLRLGLPALSERLRGLEFEPLERPAGFRRLAGTGSVSGAATSDPFIGLGATAAAATPSCAGLFEGDVAPGIVPVAYFSDYNCAYCRVLGPRLEALEGVRITWHELPLLGEGSVVMARAALAAGLQGAYEPFHHALMRSPRPSPNALPRIVEALDLDGARLRADMAGQSVDRRLARSRAVAALFGFYATPSTVVGRSVVIGAVGEVTLDRLVARERADGPVPACT